MARGPENIFKNRARKELEEIPNSWWETIQQKSIRGTPDIIGCVCGVFIALEFKASEKATRSKLQVYKSEKIKKCKGISLFVYPENWDSVISFLKKIPQLSRKEEYFSLSG